MCRFQAERTTASHCLSPGLNFFVCEMGIIVFPISQDYCEDQHIKQSQRLAHTKLHNISPPFPSTICAV